MSITEIANLISSIGFPIVMCLLIFKRMDEQDNRYQEQIKVMTDSLNKNTEAINLLKENISNAWYKLDKV